MSLLLLSSNLDLIELKYRNRTLVEIPSPKEEVVASPTQYLFLKKSLKNLKDNETKNRRWKFTVCMVSLRYERKYN